MASVPDRVFQRADGSDIMKYTKYIGKELDESRIYSEKLML